MFEKNYFPLDEVAQRWKVGVPDLLQQAALGELRLVAIFKGGAHVTHNHIEETQNPDPEEPKWFYIPDKDEWLCGSVIIPLTSRGATDLWRSQETQISGWEDEETGLYITVNYYSGATRHEDPNEYTFTPADVFLTKSEIDRVEKSKLIGLRQTLLRGRELILITSVGRRSCASPSQPGARSPISATPPKPRRNKSRTA